MTELQATTTLGTSTVLQEATVHAFKTSLRGALLCPGDDGYDAARTVYNAMIDRRPALIARCAGTADVIAGVQFARAHHLLASVRGGGHNVAGNAVCDGGIMLDLSPMQGIRVDPAVGRCGPSLGSPGATLTAKHRPSGWPPLGACSRPRVSPA